MAAYKREVLVRPAQILQQFRWIPTTGPAAGDEDRAKMLRNSNLPLTGSMSSDGHEERLAAIRLMRGAGGARQSMTARRE